MIQLKNVTKLFGNIVAIHHLSIDIPQHTFMGIGGNSNSGKSTLLKLINGTYRADVGSITYFEHPIYDSERSKSRIILIPDHPYFFENATLEELKNFYQGIYKRFDKMLFYNLIEQFNLHMLTKVSSLPNDQLKCAALCLSIACKPHYLLCDEILDDLTPENREITKSILYDEYTNEQMSILLTSKNNLFLEEICSEFVTLDKGRLMEQDDITKNNHKNYYKVQCAFEQNCQYTKKDFKQLNLLSYNKNGSVYHLTVYGEKEEISTTIKSMNPILIDILLVNSLKSIQNKGKSKND